MIALLVVLIVLVIVVVIACLLIDLLPLPPPIPMLCKLLVGVFALAVILQQIWPLLGSSHMLLR